MKIDVIASDNIAKLGEVYNIKRIGPRTEPCGTPQLRLRGFDQLFSKLTKDLRFDK